MDGISIVSLLIVGTASILAGLKMVRQGRLLLAAGIQIVFGLLFIMMMSIAGSHKNQELVEKQWNFSVKAEHLGSGNVLQAPTNVTSTLGIGVVIITSANEKHQLGRQAILMDTSLKEGEPITAHYVTVTVNGHPLQQLFVAERMTNKVAKVSVGPTFLPIGFHSRRSLFRPLTGP